MDKLSNILLELIDSGLLLYGLFKEMQLYAKVSTYTLSEDCRSSKQIENEVLLKENRENYANDRNLYIVFKTTKI